LTATREWALVTGVGLVALAVAGLAEPLSLAGSLPVWAWCSFLLFRLLPENRREPGGDPLPSLGAATLVTMTRGALVALASGFLRTPHVAAPAYTAAALLDGVDGPLARRENRVTPLGAKLDLEIDAAGVLVASVAGVVLGKLPYWYVLVGLTRYLFLLGIAWRRRRGRPVRDLDPMGLRRILAGAQMGFLAASLWPVVPEQPVYALSYLFGAATLGVFLRDWLYVSFCRG
jgi:CDP-diacylglycerol--glycerol-3-phosphate 3-phosphatidyltransferase